MAGNNNDDEQEKNYTKGWIRAVVEREHLRDAIRCATDDNILLARSQAIKWMLEIDSRVEIGHDTLFMAVMNLDRYLAKGFTGTCKDWACRLISNTCLSLAISASHKEQEVDLHDYLHPDELFSLEDINRMRKFLSAALESHVPMVHPYDYISPLGTLFFDESSEEHLMGLTRDVLIAAVRDRTIMELRSYNIAMGAILLVMDPEMTPQALAVKVNDEWPDNIFDLDEIWTCYSHLKEQESVKECIDVAPDITQGEDLVAGGMASGHGI